MVYRGIPQIDEIAENSVLKSFVFPGRAHTAFSDDYAVPSVKQVIVITGLPTKALFALAFSKTAIPVK